MSSLWESPGTYLIKEMWLRKQHDRIVVTLKDIHTEASLHIVDKIYVDGGSGIDSNKPIFPISDRNYSGLSCDLPGFKSKLYF